jgi:hypothetical protein
LPAHAVVQRINGAGVSGAQRNRKVIDISAGYSV